MASTVHLVLLGGVFVLGGVGGAAALHMASAPARAKAQRPLAAPGAHALDLDELRTALGRLGVQPPSPAVPSPSDASAKTVPAQQEASDPEPYLTEGEAAADILARLEQDYRAAQALAPQPTEEGVGVDAAPVPVEPPRALPAPPAPAVAMLPSPQASEQDTTHPEPRAVASAETTPRNVQIFQGDVHSGDVNLTTVNESHVNEIAVTTYQQLFLLSPQAVSGARPASGSGRRTPGPSPQDSNPWASVDYGSHYANPWAPVFGRRP